MDSYHISVGKFEFDFKIKARRYDDMMNLKMDLHIHTPASKCCLEEDNDETYYNILKQAAAEKIDIIAITDHNTIDGYKHFFTLKENLLSERKALLPYSEKATDIAERINQIDTFGDVIGWKG